MSGFFNSTSFKPKKLTLPLIPKCGACKLDKTCKSPKMAVSGKGKKKVLLVGEAPAKNEDDQGLQFVGESGKILNKVLRKIGVNMREDCWITNALICRPGPDNKIQDPKAVEYCRPNLLNTLKELQPLVTILLGGTAIDSLIGFLRPNDVGPVARWLGWHIPLQRFNTWVCPTWHPAFLLYDERKGSGFKNPVLEAMFEQHLRKVFDHVGLGPPWIEVPDYPKQCKAILDPEDAANQVALMGAFNSPLAFDYETNMLKPDSDLAQIVCCSVSDGHTSVAFPWTGKVIKVMRNVIQHSPMIASNASFENRWSTKAFGNDLKINWHWDTMLAAHTLNSWPEVSSIKFQAFVKLGQEPWNEHIEPFLKSDAPNKPNRIKQVPMEELLLYNAMDSLLEFKVAELQKDEVGI